MDDVRRFFAPIPSISVATVGPDGAPHVATRWFVWTEEAIDVACDRDGRTWRNAGLDPRVALAGEAGRAWGELAGFSCAGSATLLAAEDAAMRGPLSAWHEKYRGLLQGDGFERLTGRIERLGFLRIRPEDVRTWDHR
jgi:hypothetical protein